MNPRGKAFQKGDDPRRNKNGQRNGEAVRFAKEIRDALIEEGEKRTTRKGKRAGMSRFQSMIVSVWDKAEQGAPWAVEYISERVEGKVKELTEHSGTQTIKVEYVKRTNGAIDRDAPGASANSERSETV